MKNLKDFLSEDECLTQKITYEDFIKPKSKSEDFSLEEVFEDYKNLKEKNSESDK